MKLSTIDQAADALKRGELIIVMDDENRENEGDFIGSAEDITSEKEIETLKEDFAATLTHDLKVPIVAASNMIDLFLAKKFGEISDKQEFALNSMKSSNNELLNLVQILLETYKIKEKGAVAP